ncbi:hypothetical protein D6C93_01663 [Aureobasidium pullulans]|nr:hypothetical protein D6C93_01663 [Aureobasidium pullulans]
MALRVFRLLRPSIPSFHVSTVGLDSSFWHINPWFYGLLRFKRYSHHFSLLSGHQVGVHFSCYNAKTY